MRLGAAAVEDRDAIAGRAIVLREERRLLVAIVEPVGNDEGALATARDHRRDRFGERPGRDDRTMTQRYGLSIECDAVA